MAELRIGLDVDGVLADFNPAYIELLTKQTGIKFPEVNDQYPDTWNYDRAAGVKKEDETAVWNIIKGSEDFWFKLLPYHNVCAFLVWLKYLRQDTYFITNRCGSAKSQTERWLHKAGYPEPTVLISSEKAMVCKALNITHYIDDKNENCNDVKCYASRTKGYMLKRPWNEPIESVPRLSSLKDFQNILVMARLEGKDGV